MYRLKNQLLFLWTVFLLWIGATMLLKTKYYFTVLPDGGSLVEIGYRYE